MTNSNGNRITPGGNDAENVLRKIKKQLCELEKMLKEADLEQPPKPFDYGGDEAALLNKLSESEKNRRNDLIIWKHYSKTGGIYDMLTDLETAVKKPAVNAFDFDEDENTYIIFITVNNSILSHLKTLWGKMEKELGEDEEKKEEMEEREDDKE